MTKDQERELDALRQRLGMRVDPTLAERQWNRAIALRGTHSPYVRRALDNDMPADAHGARAFVR